MYDGTSDIIGGMYHSFVTQMTDGGKDRTPEKPVVLGFTGTG